MSDKCNCYRFSPRDSLSGAVAQIADYLSKHPGWNETELRTFVDGLIILTGVESFNGRTGTVTLDKNDVNNLKIASAYFAKGDESINSLDLVSLYNQGVRFVFTGFNNETKSYNLSFVLDYSSDSGNVVYYPISADPITGGNVVSVNGKTGNVELKVVDVSNGNSSDKNAYIFIDEAEDYPDIVAPDSSKLGGQLPSYYASAEEVSKLKGEKANKSIVSDAWQSGKTYAVGAYCIYNDRLYKALVQTTAEPTSNSDWTECTIADEIIAITTKNTEHKVLTTDYGSIIFFAHDKVVSFYGALANMPTSNSIEVGYVPVNPPNYNYVLFPAYHQGSPYNSVGSTWIYSDGRITLFKNDEITSVYLYGTYVINN